MSSTISPRKSSVKFARQDSNGQMLSFSRDSVDAGPGPELTSISSGGPNDYADYTVLMPPTPDNQPYNAVGSSSSKSDVLPPLPNKSVSNSSNNVGGAPNRNKLEKRISLMKTKSMLVRTQTGDFDHNRWLFESKGTYGVGNAFYPKDSAGVYDDDGGMNVTDFMDKPWKPLTRKVRIPAAILSPYRVLILTRLICLIAFLIWRISNANTDALWLWGLSIICEIWFAFSWLLDILPKINPINRAADLAALQQKFESPSPSNPMGRSDLPGIDVFISTADPEKEPPLVTANTILSVLATEYPVEKLTIYLSDDGGSLLTFEAMEKAATFAKLWVPFCRKHCIEPRNPETYFNLKVDPTKNKKQPDFVKDRRWIKREYDEFKVRINGLPELIRKRSITLNSRLQKQAEDPERAKSIATWMADGTQWPGTWKCATSDHSTRDHAGIVRIMINAPDQNPVYSNPENQAYIQFNSVDIRIPMLVYVSREKRPAYDHNKKAGAMNALVRASAILSNGPFILNLDCDHYIYNSLAIREGMCYMMDRGGDRICYIQYPQRFEGIDPSDRYANHNTVFFDGNMRALDGLQGPMYVGTGCLFRRYALYGFCPPRTKVYSGLYGQYKRELDEENEPLNSGSEMQHSDLSVPNKFGESNLLLDSIVVAEFQGRPLADHPSVKNGRPPGALLGSRIPLDSRTVTEAISVISCFYENGTEWGDRIGWIYGSVTEDVVTGYRMHNRGWRSVYCITKRDAFRGTAPINLTDRLHQVLRWATGSVEIFFSKNNALLATPRLKFLQRIAYINVAIYPFTSIFLLIYCFLPAVSLFTGQFVVQSLNSSFLLYLLLITVTLSLLSLLEIKWSNISLQHFWRNEQFWVIGGTSAHLTAVLQGLLKLFAGIHISFTLTSKSTNEDEDNAFADLYLVKWTSLFIPPLTILAVNIIAIFIGVSRTLYSVIPQWSKLIGGLFFSFWVLAHMYPFCKGLMGRRGRTPTIVYVWAGLIAITISLLWLALSPPNSNIDSSGGGI